MVLDGLSRLISYELQKPLLHQDGSVGCCSSLEKASSPGSKSWGKAASGKAGCVLPPRSPPSPSYQSMALVMSKRS